MTDTRHTIELDGETFEYLVRRSGEATRPRIDVGIHDVRVVIPEGDSTDPKKLLSRSATWVIDKKRKFDEYRAQAPERRFRHGETFPYLGTPHELVITDEPVSEVYDGAFRLSERRVRRTSVRDELENLYRRQARSYLENRLGHFSQKLGVEPRRLELRNQRTRWASCSTRKTFSFNWRLMMAPPAVIDYVVVHELAHLKERHHNRRFWNEVRKHVPDYQNHVEWLNANSSRLIFDESDL